MRNFVVKRSSRVMTWRMLMTWQFRVKTMLIRMLQKMSLLACLWVMTMMKLLYHQILK